MAGAATVPSGNGAGTAVLVGTGVVAAGGAGAYLYFRNRRKKAGQASSASYGPQGAELDPLASLSVEELRRKSGSLLIEADDAIKSSEQELMFAQAQYGDSAVGNFTKALQEAKGHMSESFKLQQQLDDHIPDTEEQQRSWLGEIIRRSEAALASLQEQKADFDSLRELEKNAPQAVAAVKAGRSEADAKIASAEQSLTLSAPNMPTAHWSRCPTTSCRPRSAWPSSRTPPLQPSRSWLRVKAASPLWPSAQPKRACTRPTSCSTPSPRSPPAWTRPATASRRPSWTPPRTLPRHGP